MHHVTFEKELNVDIKYNFLDHLLYCYLVCSKTKHLGVDHASRQLCGKFNDIDAISCFAHK